MKDKHKKFVTLKRENIIKTFKAVGEHAQKFEKSIIAMRKALEKVVQECKKRINNNQ